MHEGTDGHGIDNGADADRAAQDHPDDQDGHFDGGTRGTDGMPAGGKTGHQPVPRPWSQTRPDVAGG